MDADIEHRHKYIILSKNSHQSISIFSLVSQVLIPQSDKKGLMTPTLIVSCVMADKLITEDPVHLSKQITIC